MSSTASTKRAAGVGGSPGTRDGAPRGGRIRPSAGAALAAALSAAVALTMTGPAGAASTSGAGAGAAHGAPPVHLTLRAMPAGTVTFGRGSHGRLTARADMFGLTPGSSHSVDLLSPGRVAAIRFSQLTADSAGQADAVLQSNFTGQLLRGSRLVIRMGAASSRLASAPIAQTRLLSRLSGRPVRLVAVEVTPAGISYGTPRGRATISYNRSRHTLTVTVNASAVTPGPHAAHIHLGSCLSQGPVKYMLPDLVANLHGRIVHAVRVFTNVTTPVPASGWYLNIHQGNSGDILSNGQPTIFFRPLICADIATARSARSEAGGVAARVRAAVGTVTLAGGILAGMTDQPGAGSSRRPSASQRAAVPQAAQPAMLCRPTRARPECFSTVDRASDHGHRLARQEDSLR